MGRKKKNEVQVVNTEENNILLEEKFDKEAIRNELKAYVDERVNKVFVDELDKANKKVIREKSRRIFWKNVIIIILLLVIAFLLYFLYTRHYFDEFFNHNNDIVDKDKNIDKIDDKGKEKEEKKEEKKEPTLDELKKEYGDLLDNYYVTDSSIYLSDFYDGKLTKDMMKYMTINSFNFASFDKEEDYNIIKEATFKMMYEKLFDDEYIAASFSYDENKVRYVKQMESYMSESLLVREDSNIKREIKAIEVDGDKVIITTIEGVIVDNKLHNVITNEEIEYSGDSLIKYEGKLNKVVYTFKNNKLIGLSK